MRHLGFKEMLVAALVATCFAMSTASAARYDAARTAISSGRLSEAGTILEGIFRDEFIDAEGFYLSSKLEPRGDLAVEHLLKSLELCEDDCGASPAQLADAYYASGRYRDVIDLYDEHRKKVDETEENLKFFWFSGLAYLRIGEHSEAEKVFKEIEKEFKKSTMAGWGTIGRACVKGERGDISDARSLLRPLVSAGGEISVLAIYNRAYFACRDGNKDDALFGFDVLNHEFGEFIGDADLSALIMSGKDSRSGVAERLVDITYTVEMGVFGDKSEADRLTAKLKSSGWTVAQNGRMVGDRKYWVVQVGVFRSQESAQGTREKLESLFPGSYRVVIR